MPVFNSAPFLRESIGSVLSQSFRDFELIAVDDGSSDQSWEILQSLEQEKRIRAICRGKNQGAATARNEGIEKSDAEYIAFLDADDLAKPDRLQIQVQAMERHRQVDLLFGRAVVKSDRGLAVTPPGPSSDADVGPTLLFRNCIVQSSVMVRRRGWRPFDPDFEPAEDYDLWTRLVGVLSMYPLGRVLVTYHEHPQGISKRLPEKMAKAVAAIHKRQLARLGVEERIELHSRLTAWPWNSGEDQLKEAEAWLLELLAANRIYPQLSFRLVSEKIWFEVCLNSLALGPTAFAIYGRSKLAALTPGRLWQFTRRFGRRSLFGIRTGSRRSESP
jgi:glycosyltransferase involved in cell wall biosynthesis